MNPVRSFRRAQKMTQQQLAEAVGLRSKAYISAIENDAEVCSLRVALRLQKFSAGAIPAAAICPEAAALSAEAAEARP